MPKSGDRGNPFGKTNLTALAQRSCSILSDGLTGINGFVQLRTIGETQRDDVSGAIVDTG